MEQNRNNGALATLSTVFFFWGFIAAGNSVFIPFCKNYFSLDQFQSQLIDLAFYLAYYVGALIIFLVSASIGRDFINQWGYKKSIVIGLLISAFGSGVMIIAVYLDTFGGMLLGFFTVALGFSLQQTSANPFMILLGDEATGSSRINLGGGINSFGTLIGPLIAGLALFGSTKKISDEMIQGLPLTKVIVLYAFVGLLFLFVAAIFGFSKKLPAGKIQVSEEKKEKPRKAIVLLISVTAALIICYIPVFYSYSTSDAVQITTLKNNLASIEKEQQQFIVEKEQEIKDLSALSDGNILSEELLVIRKEHEVKIKSLKSNIEKIQSPIETQRVLWLSAGLLAIVAGLFFAFKKGQKQKVGWGAMQYPQLSLGMLAIFSYVGVEVAIGSNLSELLNNPNFGGYSSSEVAPFIAMFWGSLMIGRWSGAISAFNIKDSTQQKLKVIVPLIAFIIVLVVIKLTGFDPSVFYWFLVCVIVQVTAFILTKDKPALTLSVFSILGVIAVLIGMSTSGMVAIYAFLSCGLFCSIMWPSIFSLSLAGLGKFQPQGSAFLVMMVLGGAIIPPIQGKLADITGIQSSFIVGAFCFGYLVFFAMYLRVILKKQGVSLDDAVS